MPEEKRRFPDPLDLIPPPPWEAFPPPWEKREQKKEEIPVHQVRSRQQDKESVRHVLAGLGYQVDSDQQLFRVLDSLR